MTANYQLLLGDCVEVMRQLEPGSVQTCITSPPYYGLRSYLPDGHPDKALEIGGEETPEAFVAKLVDVFREVRRLLRDDGTCWVNLGDTYAGSWGAMSYAGSDIAARRFGGDGEKIRRPVSSRLSGDLKAKDLIGIPWMVAFALRADGWYLRSDIIWHKPNPMPESVTDRPTKAHEYIFLLSKSSSYYYDADAIKEPTSINTHWTYPQPDKAAIAGITTNGTGKSTLRSKRDSFKREGSKREQAIPGQAVGTHRADRDESEWDISTRNKRSVWIVPTRGYAGAHFAVFPPELIEPCILAGSKIGDTVLDPFYGSGTVGAVALKHARNFIGIDIDARNLELAHDRIRKTQPVLLAVNP